MGKRLVHLSEGHQRFDHVIIFLRFESTSSAQDQQVLQVEVASSAARTGRRGRERRPRRFCDADQPLGADSEKQTPAEEGVARGAAATGRSVQTEKVLYLKKASGEAGNPTTTASAS